MSSAEIEALIAETNQLWQQGRNREALAVAHQVVERARATGDRDTLSWMLNNVAVMHGTLGEYEAAIAALTEGLEIGKETMGPDHPNVIAGQNNLAELYREAGALDASETLYRETLETGRDALGPAHKSVATSLNGLGTVLHARGAFAEAKPLYEEALEIRRVATGPTSDETATTLTNFGALLTHMADHAGAEPLLLEALDIRQRLPGGPRSLEVAQTLNDLGELYREKGDFRTAVAVLTEALEIRRTALGRHPLVATTLSFLGAVHEAVGDYASAEPLYTEALELREAAFGRRHAHVAASLHDLAELKRATGELSAAEPLLREAQDIRKTTLGPRHPNVATGLNALGSLYQSMGDDRAAERAFREALEIGREKLGPRHPHVGTTLNNLGTLYLQIRNYEAAVSHLQEAREIDRAALGAGHSKVATSLNNLAVAYRAIGDYEAAIANLREALEVGRQGLGPRHPQVITTLGNLGTALGMTGDSESAAPLLLEAAEAGLQTLGDRHPNVATYLNNLASELVTLGRPAEGLGRALEASRIHDRLISQIFSIGSERQRLAYVEQLRGSFEALISIVLRYFPNDPEAVASALDLVLRRKAIVAEALAAERDAVLAGRHPELSDEIHKLIDLRMQIAHKTLAGPGAEGLEEHNRLLEEWEEQKESLEGALANVIPGIGLEERFRQADIAAVSEALPEGSALVEFVRVAEFDFQAVPSRGEEMWKAPRYLAFVLPAGEPKEVRMADLGEADQIDEAVARLRAHVGRRPGARGDGPEVALGEWQGPGEELRAAVFDPFLLFLGRRRRLFLSPDGDLSKIPFEILPDALGEPLIENWTLSYVSSGRDMVRFKAAAETRPETPVVRQSLVYADPDFDLGGERAETAIPHPEGRQSRDLDPAELHFDRLEWTREEGVQIGAILGVTPRLDVAALEAHLKDSRSPPVLHLATHGFFLSDQEREETEPFGGMPGETGLFGGARIENPLLRSGLALAGANTFLEHGRLPPEAEDGILTAEDVSGLDLLDTDLVVLSACETGLGEIRTGEGVFGLRRAFVLAGAKTLVMSLWQVPDIQTEEIMEGFYGRLNAGEPRAEALREAQRDLRKLYPHPYFWGAFICQGDPGPLPQE